MLRDGGVRCAAVFRARHREARGVDVDVRVAGARRRLEARCRRSSGQSPLFRLMYDSRAELSAAGGLDMKPHARIAMMVFGFALAAGRAQTGARARPQPEVVTHLFTDWTKVDPGNAVFPVDLDKLSSADRALFDKVYDYYKVTLEGVHGMKPPARINTPHGVRVRPERARKLGPWLDADRPWESGGATVGTVLQEGGRYRLWYSCTWAGSDKAVVAPAGRLKLGSD